MGGGDGDGFGGWTGAREFTMGFFFSGVDVSSDVDILF